jgi:hypothetical protein
MGEDGRVGSLQSNPKIIDAAPPCAGYSSQRERIKVSQYKSLTDSADHSVTSAVFDLAGELFAELVSGLLEAVLGP